MQRRDFFKSFKKTFDKSKENKKTLIIRPPYFNEEALFEQICIECDGKCASVCEENIISIIDKTPQITFEKRGCTYCDECAKACDKGVLKVEYKKNINVTSFGGINRIIGNSGRVRSVFLLDYLNIGSF